MKNQPATKPKLPTLPRGRRVAQTYFGWEEGDGTPIPALVTISCPSRKSAAALVKAVNKHGVEGAVGILEAATLKSFRFP